MQRDPNEGEPSTEKTEFRVLYNATTLYIGVVSFDRRADRILATEQRRDDRLESDDTVTIVLDTFHDHRNAFLFRTNPLGTQYDALITDEGTNEALSTDEGNIDALSTDETNDDGNNDEGNNVNESWDEKWEVASQVSAEGWTAEFAIPFKSLRMGGEDKQLWGLDLERVIRRKNELTYWNGFERGFNLEHVSHVHLGAVFHQELNDGVRSPDCCGVHGSLPCRVGCIAIDSLHPSGAESADTASFKRKFQRRKSDATVL